MRAARAPNRLERTCCRRRRSRRLAATATATAGPTTVLRTGVSGAAEVAGPGDPDGKGNGVVRVDRSSGESCVVITTRDTRR